MTISCQQCREWLSDLLEDEDQLESAAPSLLLAAPALNGNGASHAPSRALLLAHLATCADCACDLNMIRNLRAELRRLPQQQAPADLRARVRAQLTASPASAPLLAPPVVGIEHLNQVPAANGHYRPAPRPVPLQPGFLTSLTRFFSRPANLAWASGVALAAFGLVLFTQEQHSVVMPTTGEPAVTPQAIALAPHSKPSGAHGATITSHASAPSKQLAAVKPQPKNLTATDTAPAPDAALPAPAVSVPDANEGAATRHEHTRHGLAMQGSSETHARAIHQATSPTINHGSPAAHVNKVAPTNTAIAPQSAHTVQNNAVVPSPTPPSIGSSVIMAQASGDNAPFAQMTLLAANAAPNKANSTQANPVAPVPNGPENVAPPLPATTNVEPTVPGSPVSSSPRIAVAPDGHHLGAPHRPQTLIKPTPVAPVLNFGPVGAERMAHLVVVPPRDVKAARLDVTLSSGLSYADQKEGNWRSVWQGKAQQGQPIAINLHLVASASGTQQVKVVLKEVSATDSTGEDATPVQDETLNLNVTAPTGTNP